MSTTTKHVTADHVKITITAECEHCDGGRNKPFLQWCSVCDRSFSQDELRDWAPFHYHTERVLEATLPCGHEAWKLSETNYCAECENVGSITQQISVTELLKMMVPEIRTIAYRAATDAAPKEDA